MVTKFTKKLVKTVLRRKDDSSEEPKTPEEKIAQMSEKDVRKLCLKLQDNVDILNEALAGMQEKDQILTEQADTAAEEVEAAREYALDSFEKVFGPGDKESETLAKLTGNLETLVREGKINRELGRKVLVDARAVMALAKKYPQFKNQARSWNAENRKLKEDVAGTKQEMVDLRKELRLLRQVSELNDVKNWTLELIRNSPKLALSQRVNEYLKITAGDASQSGVREMEKVAIFTIISDLLVTEKKYFIDSAKEQRKSRDSEAKFDRLIEQLSLINSEAVQEIKDRLRKAEELKDAEEKGGERGVSEPYVKIMGSVVPKAFTRRAILQDIYSILLTHFPEDRATLAKLAEGAGHMVDADVKVAEYIKNKLVQQKSALTHLKDASGKMYEAIQKLFPETAAKAGEADSKQLAEILSSEDIPAVKTERLAGFIVDHLAARYSVEEAKEKLSEDRETFYDLAVLATDNDVDDAEFDKNPAAYVVAALNQLRKQLLVIEEHSTSDINPLALVRQAYIHNLLGNAYSADGQEKQARAQFDRARALCDSAVYSVTDKNRDAVMTEIKKLNDFTEGTKDE